MPEPTVLGNTVEIVTCEEKNGACPHVKGEKCINPKKFYPRTYEQGKADGLRDAAEIVDAQYQMLHNRRLQPLLDYKERISLVASQRELSAVHAQILAAIPAEEVK